MALADPPDETISTGRRRVPGECRQHRGDAKNELRVRKTSVGVGVKQTRRPLPSSPPMLRLLAMTLLLAASAFCQIASTPVPETATMTFKILIDPNTGKVVESTQTGGSPAYSPVISNINTNNNNNVIIKKVAAAPVACNSGPCQQQQPRIIYAQPQMIQRSAPYGYGVRPIVVRSGGFSGFSGYQGFYPAPSPYYGQQPAGIIVSQRPLFQQHRPHFPGSFRRPSSHSIGVPDPIITERGVFRPPIQTPTRYLNGNPQFVYPGNSYGK